MKEIVDRVKLNWSALPTKKRRQLIISGSVILLVFVVVVLGIIDTMDKREKRKQKEAGPIVTDMEEASITDRPGTHFLDALAGKNAAYEREELRGDVAAIRGEAEAFRSNTQQNFDKIEERFDGVNQQLGNVGRSLDELSLRLARESATRKAQAEMLAGRQQALVNQPGAPIGAYSESTVTSKTSAASDDGVLTVSPFDMMQIAQVSNLNLQSMGGGSAYPQLAVSQQTESYSPNSTAAEQKSSGTDSSSEPVSQQLQQDHQPEVASAEAQEEQRSLYDSGDLSRIPAGSLIKANLISGLDAPVGQTAQQNPHPIMAKVVDRVLLPNGHYADLSGCVMLASGYGDLSSERVFMQTATISCVSKKREIFEADIKSSALGPDGKVGVRGTVITKDGSLIAKNMQAGAIQGLALAFSGGGNSGFSVQTDQPYALPDSEYIGRTMIGQGVSNSLDAMIDRYNKIMDQITPVIEVHAGTHVEFQVLQGFDIRVSR